MAARHFRRLAVAVCLAALAAGIASADARNAFIIGSNVCADPVALLNAEALWSTWQGIIALGVLIVFLVAGLAYILAGLANHRGLRVWATNQMYEGLVTIFLGVIAIGLVAFMCTVNMADFGTSCVPALSDVAFYIGPSSFCAGAGCFSADTQWGSCTPFAVAQFRLQDFRNHVSDAFLTVTAANFIASAFASIKLRATATGLGAISSPGFGLSALVQQLQLSLIAIVTLHMLTTAQILILKMSQFIFAIFLPVGILFRSFGVTRGFGGALIAIAIGLGLAYPVLAAFFYDFTMDSTASSLTQLNTNGNFLFSTQHAAINIATCANIGIELVNYEAPRTPGFSIRSTSDADASDGTCEYVGSDAVTYQAKRVYGEEWQVFSINSVSGNDPLSLVLSLLSPSAAANSILNFFKWMFNSTCGVIGILVLGAVFVPFVTFAVLISFIRSLSGMFGEEVDIGNLTRLI